MQDKKRLFFVSLIRQLTSYHQAKLISKKLCEIRINSFNYWYKNVFKQPTTCFSQTFEPFTLLNKEKPKTDKYQFLVLTPYRVPNNRSPASPRPGKIYPSSFNFSSKEAV